MTRFISSLIIVFLLSTLLLSAQSKQKKFQALLPFDIGYQYQGTHTFFFGVKSALFLDVKNFHNNIGLIINGNLTYVNNTAYMTPVAKLRLYKEQKNRKYAWETAIGYSYTNISKKIDGRLTPELGISKWSFYLCYGYNISLTNYVDPYTTRHKIAFYLGIF